MGGEGKGREGREGMGREGTPNILLHPQFQFSRNMPDRGTASTSTVSSGDPPPLRAAIGLLFMLL